MAYFDSPKNRAFWNKELEGLKKQRAAYENGVEEIKEKSVEVSSDGFLRERISFAELNEEEYGKKPEALYMPMQKSKIKEAHLEM